MTSWDDIDRRGRHHARVEQLAYKKMIQAFKNNDTKAAFAWSFVMARHAQEATKLAVFKWDKLINGKSRTLPQAARIEN
ncbi:MAG: hypothetical protein ACYCQJ_15215 [Nitrososphaerales archaeon]